jgi:hypothetical protein
MDDVKRTVLKCSLHEDCRYTGAVVTAQLGQIGLKIWTGSETPELLHELIFAETES